MANDLARKAQTEMNRWGRAGIPFLFVIDYQMKKPVVVKLSDLENSGIRYRIQHKVTATVTDRPVEIEKKPVSFKKYSEAFDIIRTGLLRGDSFLTNLTQPTQIEMDISLNEIFKRSQARYNLLFEDQFVVFSPETFVRIQDGIIYSHPMKGTQKNDNANAETALFNNPKELAEHATIVDLIRNDLSRFAQKVKVDKFRYLEPVVTHHGQLLQMSSQISGTLADNYPGLIGDLIFGMLPAGSVTGAPKAQTLQLIAKAENYDRGYYTGVFGIFDGKNLDSGVMIRFIEKTPDGYLFKSGGGITALSTPESEYQEMIDKIYLPF